MIWAFEAVVQALWNSMTYSRFFIRKISLDSSSLEKGS